MEVEEFVTEEMLRIQMNSLGARATKIGEEYGHASNRADVAKGGCESGIISDTLVTPCLMR